MHATAPTLQSKPECSQCHQLSFTHDGLTTYHSASLCTDCHSEHFTTCDDCGDSIDRDDAYVVFPDTDEERTLCPDCYDDQYTTCEDCGDTIEHHDTVTVNVGTNDERVVCDDCLDDYDRCNRCGYYYSSHHMLSDSYSHYCPECSDHYIRCEGCGELAHENECYYDDASECNYCETCYNERETATIHPYGYKPSPIFLNTQSDARPNDYYGIELEVDDGDDAGNATYDIATLTSDIYLKSDCSLGYSGFEIVSHPATLQYHLTRLPWREIMQTARQYGYKSHDTDTCGLHVHISRRAFGDDDIQDLNVAKLVILVDRLWPALVKLSRRDYSQLERWAKKPSADVRSTDDDATMLAKVDRVKQRYDRYQAVNLENYHTVELRMFRGTLNYQTFTATLQLVATLVDYARTHSLKEMQVATIADIRAHNVHSELEEYLTDKGF